MKLKNLVVLVLFIVVTIWVLTRSDQTVSTIRKAYYQIMGPLLIGGSSMEKRAKNFLAEMQHHKEWKLRYELAKEELDEKRMEVAHLRKLELENIELKKALKFKKNSAFYLIAASIIERRPSIWSSTMTIDKGMNHGIERFRPVLSPEGLVGKIELTSPKVSTVILITDEKCQVSAKIQSLEEAGIVKGMSASKLDEPKMQLNFLSKDAQEKIRPGMRVISTGRGGLFPPDILIGTIEEYISGDLSGSAIVKPAVDFSRLHTVFIQAPNRN